MRMIKQYILFLLMLLGFDLFAQQDAQYTQYMFNGLVINPAYAGNKGIFNINGVYRDQWAGIDGAPRTMTISVDGPIYKKTMALGLDIIKDKIGAQDLFSLYTSYSYRLKLSNEGTLSLGLALGLTQYSFDGSQITLHDNTDLSKPGSLASDLALDAKTGVYYSTNNFYSGFSVSNLFAPKIYNVDVNSDIPSFSTVGRHFFLNTGYIYEFDGPWKLYPSVLVKEDLKGPTNIDLNALALYNGALWFGMSYRTSLLWFKPHLDNNLKQTDVIALIFAIHLSDKIRVGYSYDITTSELGHYDSGSHEISFAYFLYQRSTRMLSPRYF